MVVVNIQLADEIAGRLTHEAQRRNTTLERFIADNADKLLAYSAVDMQQKLDRILEEDHELLRRLA